MNKAIKLHTILVVFVLGAVLAPAQMALSEPLRICHLNAPHLAEVPQWVRDRQQYETTFVYDLSTSARTTRDAAPSLPQWVRDRQQYETTYVYVPSASSMPQWVRDRQQYEPSFTYVPMADAATAAHDGC